GVPKRPTGADCKSAGLTPTKVRILPPPLGDAGVTTNAVPGMEAECPRSVSQIQWAIAGVAQLVERKPSKLDVAGSSPVSRSSLVAWRTGRARRRRDPSGAGANTARVAPSVEHTLGKGEVIGSIPIASLTIDSKRQAIAVRNDAGVAVTVRRTPITSRERSHG